MADTRVGLLVTGGSVDRPPEAEAVVRAIFDADHEGATDRLISHLSPQIEVRSYMAPGRTLRGHAEVRDAFENARTTLYEPHVDRYETLLCGCVVAHGSVRYGTEGGGFSHHSAVWLFEVSDGLVHTWLGFTDAGLLHQAHDCLHDPSVRLTWLDGT